LEAQIAALREGSAGLLAIERVLEDLAGCREQLVGIAGIAPLDHLRSDRFMQIRHQTSIAPGSRMASPAKWPR
jgi:hypothetical protein